MVPVRHAKCGTQIGWYLVDYPRPSDMTCSSTFMHMDGSHPEYASRLYEVCGYCHAQIKHPRDLIRCFDEEPILTARENQNANH